ncbi:hypothetical protein SAMN05216387_105188 [Nitrosovibrio tenuis]|uniref:Transposase n=1 Tax=Nitrosovibrio tenuis TaxID=1233 RepID=A0A1H7MTF1_9PROT|nr:hypothetical protein SAMN05216387_105188 [Nitrosovibrio tenuis]
MKASGRYPRFGYRRIAVMTGQSSGRVWRLWNRLGLNLPKHRPRKRAGSFITTSARILRSAIEHRLKLVRDDAKIRMLEPEDSFKTDYKNL